MAPLVKPSEHLLARFEDCAEDFGHLLPGHMPQRRADFRFKVAAPSSGRHRGGTVGATGTPCRSLPPTRRGVVVLERSTQVEGLGV